ncbi:pantetheinase-like [Lineus longissimus]|uniref:pantetheinase-like n=1 Tax=Lineus longissimus TaxID=88925 RepID=UPI002B4C720B
MAKINFVLVLFFYICGAKAARESYVAAVFEHAPYLLDPKTVVSKEEARANMQRNLDVYEEQITKAKIQGSDIIIFPEDGLYGFGFTRTTLEPYLEDIPSPQDNSCPCSDPGNNQTMPIQYRLSCLAKYNALFVVANAGDLKPCTGDPNCPADGRFQYNTNVAYDPRGCLVARYHKQHLFYEIQFNQPTQVEFSYFDTPFGRFGFAVCFDILFKEPIIDLVLKYNVTNIAFPTAWMDALPLLSAVGFHSGWARGMGVNFLSANIHRPKHRMAGSGIYSPEGVLEYTRSDEKNGVLLVSNVSVVEQSQNKPEMKSKVIKVPTITSDVFQSVLFGDTFNFVYLDPDDKSAVVCQGSLCCGASYRATGKKEEYVIGALDRLHTLEGQYYLQICVVLKCANASRDSCGSPVTSSSWRFSELHLAGTFKTPYIFPQVITDGIHVPAKDSWTYEDKSITFQNVSDPVLSASLFGRWFEMDDGDFEAVRSAGNVCGGFMTTWIVLIMSRFFM